MAWIASGAAMSCLVRTVAAPATALLLAFAPHGAAALSDIIFQANCEAAPDCSSVGASGCPGFVIETPSLQVAAGAKAQYCYYFRTPAGGTLATGRFSSIFNLPVRQFIVYATYDNTGAAVDARPPGTFQSNCGFSAGANGTSLRWLYAAHVGADEMRMPDDDGGGSPLAIEIPGDTAGFFEILYANAGAQDMTASPVRWVANGLASGAPYTSTASLLTYKVVISIPPGSVGSPGNATESYSCSVPGSVKFWRFTTQTHRFSDSTQLSNSVSQQVLLTSSNWESPTIVTLAPPFYAFGATDKLAVNCHYLNPENFTVTTGDDYSAAETCMSVSHFFPATTAQFCISP
jgi:hypothetical protein